MRTYAIDAKIIGTPKRRVETEFKIKRYVIHSWYTRMHTRHRIKVLLL